MTEYMIEQKSVEMLKEIKSAKPVLNITGTTYYVSNDGDDTNDGLSPKTAWKTIERVNAQNDSFKLGDAVLFRCGDTFRGSVKVRGITYSNYGEGEKPHMYASPFNAAEVDWNDEGDDIYSIEFDEKLKDIGNLVFNHGDAGCGFKKWPKIGLELEFDLDFRHDLEEQKLYLKSTEGKPNERWQSIEMSVNVPVFTAVMPNGENSTIDGLIIKYSGSCSVSYSGICLKNNIVRNCEFEWIGGSILFPTALFGNAYQIWGGCDGVLIENCYFNQTYDAAVSPQWFGTHDKCCVTDFVVRNCLFERNVYDFEYFLTHFESNESRKHVDDTNLMFKDVLFENNICRKNGYGFGSRRTYRASSCCIKGWHHQNRAENFVIRNNIFDRADYLLIEACADRDEWLPTLSGNVYCQYRQKGLYDRNGRVNLTDEIIESKTIPVDKDAIIINAYKPTDPLNRF